MPALIERPEMSRAMWDALKAHILKERRRKKQEQEADAEEERLRRERENKQKQNIMTLDETKEQLAQLTKKLETLRAEKHDLFNSLKNVLLEDDKKKVTKDAMEAAGIPPNQPTHIAMGGGQSRMLMHSGNQSKSSTMYKIGMPSQSTGIHGGIKRSRSPSPGPYLNYKNSTMVAFPPKHGPFATTQPNSYYAQSAPQASSISVRGVHASRLHSLSSSSNMTGSSQPHLYSSIRSPFPQASLPPDAKHLHPGYHLQGLPHSAYAGLLQQQLEQSNSKGNFSDDRVYLPQGGSITSGFPVHVVHSGPSPYQPKSSTNPPVAHSGNSQRHSVNAPPTSRFY